MPSSNVVEAQSADNMGSVHDRGSNGVLIGGVVGVLVGILMLVLVLVAVCVVLAWLQLRHKRKFDSGGPRDISNAIYGEGELLG